MSRLVLIGYWRNTGSPEWPDPADFVDEAWDAAERHMVSAYLESATVPWTSMGFSPCRLCGKPNGSVEYTDGTYLWPEGLSHYVRDHSVHLPQAVIDHILERLSE